ncbi:MAG: hypothetical protein H0U75_05100 [Legionella sp.]|nr:hypothetical protein [Legionella sp.]
MKKTVSILLMLGLSVAFADQKSDDELAAKRLEWAKSYLEQEGLPVPDSGVKVIPEKQMSSYNETKERRIKAKKDIETLGYINESSPATERLLHLQITASHDLKAHANEINPTSTHLKKSVAELKMAYSPTTVPSTAADEYIGAAPYLTYLQDRGWVGLIQFFTNKNVGNCSYSENNLKLSHGAIVIAKEDVRDDINGKVTTVEVVGTPEEGFTYSVEWFDNDFFKRVDCANKKYSANLTNAVIDIAKAIANG